MQYLITCLISLLFYSPALADTLQGKVVKVADGDTVTIVDDSGQKHRIRLMGIDAPEKDQSYGDVSTKNLERLINGKRTTINFSKHDWYGRIVGKVLVDPPSSVNKAPSDNKYLKQGRGYFSVSGFAVSMEDTKLESDNPSIIAEAAAESANTIIAKTTDGFGGALALGFDFTGPWRIEGEFSLRVVSFDRLSVDGIPLLLDDKQNGNKRIDDATIPISSLMGNIYYDLPKILGHPPYVGGGIGMVFYENLGVADDDAFGYQFIIGINTPINKNAKLGVEYRYFSSTDPEVKDITGDVDIHSFGFKLQYYWDSPAKKGRKKSR